MAQFGRLGVVLSLFIGSSCTIQNYYPAASPPPPPSSSASPSYPGPAPSEPYATAPSESYTLPASEPTPPPVAQPVVVSEPLGEAPVQTGAALPRAAHGQIIYTDLTESGTTLIGTGPLRALDPDAPSRIVTLQSLSSTDYRLGVGIVGGYDTNAKQFWTQDLRSGRVLATIEPTKQINGFTSDGRIVSRCAGGLDDSFELCTYDAFGRDRTVVTREAGIHGEAAFVTGAGGARVLGDYASRTKAPFVFDLSTGVRRELPGLYRPANQYVTRPVISRSGALATHCFLDDTRASLVVSTLDGTRRDRTFDLGGLTRCECRFSPDDRMLACALLPNGRRWVGKPDHLVTVDLASGRSKTLSTTMDLEEFEWSPDSREIVYAYSPTEEGPSVVGIIAATGGPTRDLGPWSPAKELVGWLP